MPSFLKSILSDWSAITLLASNLITIGLAVANHWDAMTILWSFWLQSLIIGFFTMQKLNRMARQTTFSDVVIIPGMSSNGKTVGGTPRQLSKEFLFMFGGFHLVYAIFLGFFSTFAIVASEYQPGTHVVDALAVLFTGVLFFLNHAFSFRLHQVEIPADAKKEDFQRVFSEPFNRIIPIHITIIAGMFFIGFDSTNTGVLIFFLLLKTAVDLYAHLRKHQPFLHAITGAVTA